MSTTIAGVILLPTDGASAGPPVDIRHRERPHRGYRPRWERAAATAPRPCPRSSTRMTMRARCRRLVRRGRQAARDLVAAPRRDAWDRSLSRRGRRLRTSGARRGGVGDGALHPLSRPHAAGRGNARNRPRGRGCRRARHARRVHARPQPSGLRGDETRLGELPATRATQSRRSSFPRGQRRRADRARRGDRGGGGERDFRVQFGPNGPQWCSDALLRAIAEASRRTGRRVHMHLLETRYQRAFADPEYPEGVVTRLKGSGSCRRA